MTTQWHVIFKLLADSVFTDMGMTSFLGVSHNRRLFPAETIRHAGASCDR